MSVERMCVTCLLVSVLPGQPTSVRTRVIQPDTVLVSWQPPLDGGVVTGYMIGYGEGVPDVNWRYLERHRRNVTIRNLSKYKNGMASSVLLSLII